MQSGATYGLVSWIGGKFVRWTRSTLICFPSTADLEAGELYGTANRIIKCAFELGSQIFTPFNLGHSFGGEKSSQKD